MIDPPGVDERPRARPFALLPAAGVRVDLVADEAERGVLVHLELEEALLLTAEELAFLYRVEYGVEAACAARGEDRGEDGPDGRTEGSEDEHFWSRGRSDETEETSLATDDDVRGVFFLLGLGDVSVPLAAKPAKGAPGPAERIVDEAEGRSRGGVGEVRGCDFFTESGLRGVKVASWEGGGVGKRENGGSEVVYGWMKREREDAGAS